MDATDNATDNATYNATDTATYNATYYVTDGIPWYQLYEPSPVVPYNIGSECSSCCFQGSNIHGVFDMPQIRLKRQLMSTKSVYSAHAVLGLPSMMFYLCLTP